MAGALAQNRQFLTQLQEARNNQAAANTGAAIGATAAYLGACSKDYKENYTQLDEKQIAEKMEGLPVEMWNYKGDGISHIGPYAEDFKETFGVGDGKTINLMDMMSIMWITIQEQRKRINKLEAQDARVC